MTRRPDGRVLELACGHRRYVRSGASAEPPRLASCVPCSAGFVLVVGSRAPVPGADVHADGCRPGHRPDLGQDGLCECGLVERQDVAEDTLLPDREPA